MVDAELDRVRDVIGSRIRGRRWILAFEHAALGDFVSSLREQGAADVLVVAMSEGTGEVPEDTTIVLIEQGGGADTVMGSIRGTLTAFAEPPDHVRAAVDRFDPAGEARVITMPFADIEAAFGRPVDGARRREWVALEDKTTADALWDEAGIDRAPSSVVDLAGAPEAAARLDRGHGTVWVADNLTGWHGGGEFTRWVTPGADLPSTAGWFDGMADRVRVMPFLEGIPCSIHGFVTPDAVAAFRPFEMVVLRHPDRATFTYAGGASYWDPAPDERERMRSAARRVGEVLRRRVDYRGPFSIDGVMTADGFLPTELNPRLSMGLGMMAGAVDDLSIGSLVRSFVEGDLDLDADWLERTIVSAADAKRMGGMHMGLPGDPPRNDTPLGLDFDGDDYRVVDPEGAMGKLTAGPGPLGTFIRLHLDPEVVAPGPSVAPMAVGALRAAREVWGLPTPDVVAAPDVRV